MEKIIALKASEIKEVIKKRFINRSIKTRPLCLVGHKGVGKSQVVKQCPEELSLQLNQDIQFKLVNLHFCEPPDFMGLPYTEFDKALGITVTKHARPNLLPIDGAGILFIDEPNRCNRDMRQALLTLIEDRQVNGHPLGKDWIIVMAMNPSDSDEVAYEVQEFDSALEDRITKIEFKGDYEEFKNYMIKLYTDKHPVIRWLINQPDVVDYTGKLRTSPRSIEYLIKAIGADNGIISPDNEITYSTVASEIGIHAASVFQKFLSSPEFIRAEDVLNKFESVVEGLKQLDKEGRTDIINDINKGLISLLVTLKKANDAQYSNLTQYMELISADSKAAFLLLAGEKLDINMFDKMIEFMANKSSKIKEFIIKANEGLDEATNKGRKTTKKEKDNE
jgi:MoxR-like ATPase